MSKPDDDGRQPERIAFKELEGIVTDALDRLSELRARVESAEGKNLELSELLRRFTQDEGEAGRLLSRLRSLEAENADLRGRLDKGRVGVERLLAKIRFLEEQR